MRPRRFRPSWVEPFRRHQAWVQDTLAVTPVIGAVMILGISSIGVGVVMVWGIPNIQDTQAKTEFEGVLEEFKAFDEVVTNVMHGGSAGKASRVTLAIPGGIIERTPGNWMVVTWYPTNTLGPGDTHVDTTFHVSGHDVPDPTNLTIVNRGGAAVNDVDLRLETVYDTTHVTRVFREKFDWAAGGITDVAIGHPQEFKNYSTRLLIRDHATQADIAHIWMYPLGALEYTRATSQGPLTIALENGAVLSQRLAVSQIRDKPLVTKENWSDAPSEPRMLALFTMMLTDNRTQPGVAAGGAGEWPLLFSLRSNNLRANSTEVTKVALNISGPREEAFERYYIDHFGFKRQTGSPTDDGGLLLAGGVTHTTFTFVVLETIMEVSLIDEFNDLTPKPPPPIPGQPNAPGGGPGGGGGGGPSGNPIKDFGWGWSSN